MCKRIALKMCKNVEIILASQKKTFFPVANNPRYNVLVHWQIDSFMTSRRGYTLGARTGAKITPHGGPHWVYPIGVTETPAPETYQKDNTALRRFQPNRHPFGAASRRFGKTVAEPDLPGPGAYDHGEERNKHVQLAGRSLTKINRQLAFWQPHILIAKR